MSFEFTHTKYTSYSYPVTLYDAGGNESVLQTIDIVRAKITRTGEVCLELSSLADEVLPGGSTITFTPETGECTVLIGQEDTAGLDPGAYSVYVYAVDSTKISAAFPEGQTYAADRGVMYLQDGPAVHLGQEESSSSSSGNSSSSSSSSSF